MERDRNKRQTAIGSLDAIEFRGTTDQGAWSGRPMPSAHVQGPPAQGASGRLTPALHSLRISRTGTRRGMWSPQIGSGPPPVEGGAAPTGTIAGPANDWKVPHREPGAARLTRRRWSPNRSGRRPPDAPERRQPPRLAPGNREVPTRNCWKAVGTSVKAAALDVDRAVGVLGNGPNSEFACAKSLCQRSAHRVRCLPSELSCQTCTRGNTLSVEAQRMAEPR